MASLKAEDDWYEMHALASKFRSGPSINVSKSQVKALILPMFRSLELGIWNRFGICRMDFGAFPFYRPPSAVCRTPSANHD
jgi:hypothetical protein